MSNYNNWSRRERSGRGGGRGKGNRRSGPDQKRNDRRERNFPKFADNDFNKYNNDDNYWPQQHRNYNNSGYNAKDRYPNNDGGGDIVPWHRKTPIIPLVIPPQMSNNINEPDKDETNNTEVCSQYTQESAAENLNNSSTFDKKLNDRESSDARSRNNSMSKNNTAVVAPEAANTPIQTTPLTVQIKQEKQDVIRLKQEKKSSSSSSSSSESSSSESSSSEEEPEVSTKTLGAITSNPKKTKESPVTVTPSSPVNIKLKPKTNAANAPSILKKNEAPASSSSSSSEEEEEPPKPPPPCTKAAKAKSQKQETKIKSSKKKRKSEDDVVCMGNLENKIILEDDSDEEEETQDESTVSSSANKISKKTAKKTEICMICDKKGHTSFQCQMICKNCSAPYHGFRTCPLPANLNTMLQLFLEFCMQQFQHFTGAKDLNINTTETVPRPQIDAPSTNTVNKTNKLKRKQVKSNETTSKIKSTKKRKLSVGSKKKLFKEVSDDEEDNESGTSASESEEDATDSDNTSSSESLVSSKKKHKLKNNKSFPKIPFTIPNFTPNPVNLPMVLNGFPNLTAGAASVSNPNNSNSALNTLLLTQMFQNAIGSLNK